ncbi:MAG: family 20 glycosylhydrolase [Gammaproteobacteria bacterium]
MADTAARVFRLGGPSIAVGTVETAFPALFTEQYSIALRRLRDTVPQDATAATLSVSGRLVGVTEIPPAYVSLLVRPEAFWLRIDQKDGTARLTAVDERGLLQGVNRLTQMLTRGGSQLSAGEVIDWPAHNRRALHIVLQDVSPRMIRRVIDDASRAGFNTLVMQLADAVDVGSPHLPLRSNALTKRQFLSVVAYARGSGLEVIPEIKLLSHQEKFFGTAHPNLMFNKVTYDPRQDEVYKIVFDYLDRVIALLQPKAIHIGHDELMGSTVEQQERFLNPGERILPPELYLLDVKKVQAYLKDREVAVWIWGDMLLSVDEFPDMRPQNIMGDSSYAALRKQLPKELLICDWHYRDMNNFPSAAMFVAEGFDVLGVTWKKEETVRSFSRYISELGPQADGMIATIWFHLRRREWKLVTRIIRISGDAYWYAN